MDLKINVPLKAPNSFKTVESVLFIDVRYNQVCGKIHYVLSN